METNVEKTFKFEIMQINLNLLKCIMSLVGTRIFNLNKLSASHVRTWEGRVGTHRHLFLIECVGQQWALGSV